MKMNRFLPRLFLCWSCFVCLPVFAADNAEKTARLAFPEGVFELPDENKRPLDWIIDDKKYESKISLVNEENGNHFLRIIQDEAKGWPRVSAFFRLPTEWKSLHLRARMRSESLKLTPGVWCEARIGYYFVDAQFKQIKSGIVQALTQTSPWRHFSVRETVPPNAAFLKIEPSIMNAIGSADFDDIVIEQDQPIEPILSERAAKLGQTPLLPSNNLPIPPLRALGAEEATQFVKGLTSITLHHKEAAAQTVVSDLAKQIPFDICLVADDPQKPWPLVTIEADKQPFWDVMGSLIKQLKVQVKNFPPRRDLVLLRTSDNQISSEIEGLATDSGPVRVVVNKAERKAATPDSNVESDDVYLTLSALLDPRLRPMGWGTLQPAKDKPNAATFRPKSEPVEIYQKGWPVLIGVSSFATFEAPVKVAKAEKTIKKVAGSLRCEYLGQTEKWEIADPLKTKEVEKTVELNESGFATRARVVMHEVTTDGANYLVWTTLQIPSYVRFGQFAGINRFQAFRLVDAQDRELHRVGSTITRSSGYTMSSAREFSRNHPLTGVEDVGEPVKLIIEFPSEVKTIEVPFEFNNVPIAEPTATQFPEP